MLWDVVAFLFAVIVLCWQLGHSLYSCFAMANVALSLPTLWLIFDAVFARLEKLVNNFKLLLVFYDVQTVQFTNFDSYEFNNKLPIQIHNIAFTVFVLSE